jgi:Spy/CpxP family protein refolding chaperone
MSRKLAVIGIMLATMVAAASVHAGSGIGHGYGPPPGSIMEPGQGIGRMAKVLKLTDTQQTQIKAILDAEKEQLKPVFESIHEKRDQLRALSESTTFDETAVRTIATAIAQEEIELMVSRTRTQSRINVLLTADQRELLINLRPDMGRMPPPPHDSGM